VRQERPTAVTLHYGDAGMITTSNEPYGKIDGDLQLATFVRPGMQCPSHVAKALSTANPGSSHKGCRPKAISV